jgi:hypothetical protein
MRQPASVFNAAQEQRISVRQLHCACIQNTIDRIRPVIAIEQRIAGMTNKQRMLRARSRYLFLLHGGIRRCGYRLDGIQREMLIP